MSTSKVDLLRRYRHLRQVLDEREQEIVAALSGNDLTEFNQAKLALSGAIYELEAARFQELADNLEPLAAKFEAGVENLEGAISTFQDLKRAARIATEVIKIAVQLAGLVL